MRFAPRQAEKDPERQDNAPFVILGVISVLASKINELYQVRKK